MNNGKMHVNVSAMRTIEHLDPTTELHVADHIAANAARLRSEAAKAERIETGLHRRLKYPSLGGGLMSLGDGGELSSDEHKNLLSDTAKARAYYFSEGTRKDGRIRRRKRPTVPLHSLGILMRPDHAAALAEVEKHPEMRHLVKPFLLQVLRVVAQDFSAATGLDVIACQVHPEEGCLHLHLTYSSVSTDHRLLWQRGHRGRHGLRLLGPSHGGTLRLIAAGFLPASEGSMAARDFRDRVRQLHGDLPVDWQLSVAVEGLVEAFAEQHGLQGAFAGHRTRYHSELSLRRSERPAALKSAKEKVEGERDHLAAEVRALKAQLAKIAKAISVPIPLPRIPSSSRIRPMTGPSR
jgi:hypothetical protein